MLKLRSLLPFVFAAALTALFGQGPGGTAATSGSKRVTATDVIAMLEAKLPDSVIIARLRSNSTPPEVSTEDLVRLKDVGASEAVMLALVNPTAGSKGGAAESAGNGAPGMPSKDSAASPFPEVGVYYKKGGVWTEVLPEIVNWKQGGVLKNIASAGVVKKDVNGNIPGPHSRNSVATPAEFMIYAPEGVAITEYQLVRLRAKDDYREFRTVTGGVFNARSGAMRDMVPFEGKKVENRLYSVILPANLGAGEYGFLPMGSTGGAGGLTSLSMGKMYTFRILE